MINRDRLIGNVIISVILLVLVAPFSWRAWRQSQLDDQQAVLIRDTDVRRHAAEELVSCTKQEMMISTALWCWSFDHKYHYPDQLSDMVPGYLAAVPLCPTTHQPYRYQHDNSITIPTFMIICPTEHHPTYTSGIGLTTP